MNRVAPQAEIHPSTFQVRIEVEVPLLTKTDKIINLDIEKAV